MNPGAFLLGASTAYACLWAGVIARRRRSAHLTFVLTGVVLDVAVVTGLELSRHAVGTVVSGSMSTMLATHVWASASAIVCFVGAIVLGAFFVRGRSTSVVRWHRRVGWAAMTARSIGFVTMLAVSRVSAHQVLILVGVPVAFAVLAWRRFGQSRLQLSVRPRAALWREPAHDDR